MVISQLVLDRLRNQRNGPVEIAAEKTPPAILPWPGPPLNVVQTVIGEIVIGAIPN